MYRCMRGGATMKSSPSGTSNSRQRLRTPFALSEGETARHMVFFVRDASATTRSVVMGSSPRSTHSTEA